MAEIKLCGLCSKMVEESVQPNAALRAFLLTLLSLESWELPVKICSMCFQAAVDCRKFKEACDVGIRRMRSGSMPDNMILGGGGRGRSPAPPTKKAALTPGPKGKKSSLRGDPLLKEIDPEEVLADPTEGRRSRSKSASAVRSSRSSGPPPIVPADPLAVGSPKTSRSSRGSSATPSAAKKGKKGAAAAPSAVGSPSKGPKTPVIVIEAAARSRAEIVSALGGCVRAIRKKNDWVFTSRGGAPAAPVAAATATATKRPLEPTSPAGRVGPAAKKARAASAAATSPGVVVAKKSVAPRTKSSTEHTVSSFGRVRKANAKNKHFDYVDLGGEEDEEDTAPLRDPFAAKAMPRSRGALRTAADQPLTPQQMKKAKRSGSAPGPARSKNTSSSKRTPAAAANGSAAPSPRSATPSRSRAAKDKPGGFYYVDDSGEVNPPPAAVETPVQEQQAASAAAAAADDQYEDGNETFPSIGPYQCEICQQITDTKLQFVNHIKANHLEVVDEEVLKSLENDLKKKKKPPPPSKSPKAQKRPAGPASRQKQQKQQRPVSPKKKMGPASKTSTAAAIASVEVSTNSPDSTTNHESFPAQMDGASQGGVGMVSSSLAVSGGKAPLVTSAQTSYSTTATTSSPSSATANTGGGHWKASVARKYEQEANASAASVAAAAAVASPEAQTSSSIQVRESTQAHVLLLSQTNHLF